MKYIFFLLITVSLTSCSLSSSPKEITSDNTLSPVFTGVLQNSDSGTILLGESGSVIIDNTGTILIGNNSGNISVNENTKNRIGTGKTQTGSKTLQDAELKSIEQDINALFSEIEKGGK